MFDRLVMVEWMDAWSIDGWFTIPEALMKAGEEVIVYSVGYVLQETEEGICLTSAIAGGSFGNLWWIPNGMITSVTELKKGKKV